MNKFALALLLSTVATTVSAHPKPEPHTRENIAEYYKLDLTPEVIEKERVVTREVEVPVEVEKEINAWGVVSLNTIAMDSDVVEDFSYVELEGGVVVGNLDFYGFVDVNDNDSTFFKVNPKYYLFDSNWYANYTLKGFNQDESKIIEGQDVDLSVYDHYAGVGYTFRNDSGGSYSVSMNMRYSDIEESVESGDVNYNVGKSGQNGYAILTNFYQPISQDKSWSVDGWVDASFDQQTEFNDDNEHEIRGNVGVRKSFDNGMYGRLAYHFLYNDNDKVASDFDGAHLQVGWMF